MMMMIMLTFSDSCVCVNCSVLSDSLWPHRWCSHGILQTRILGWIVISFSRGSFHPRTEWAVTPMGSTNWSLDSVHYPSPFMDMHVVVVQSLSVQLSVTLWTIAHQASLSITNSQSLLKLMSTELVMPSNHLILCHPLLLPPSIFPSIRVFFNESVLHIRWPKYWSFSFSISPSNEYSGLISFRFDWFDLLTVQGILKSLLSYHSSKASISQCSAFFMVQLSYPYVTMGKTIALTRWTFFGKVLSLLFNMLFRLVIAFLPRSKRLLISWLQSPSAVILEPPENKICHGFHWFLIYLPSSDGTRCHDLHFLNVEFKSSFFTPLFHFDQEAL